jgi:hypothetical protein
MSLWYKEIDKITFEDVDAFCQQKLREGVRLDYKATIPNDLAKVVAAFANTLGGLLILGVVADPKTNVPVWPPVPGPNVGMPDAKGIEERITAICRDNIYPPVRPEISPILQNALLPGHVIVVLRVPESPEAPHAINNGRAIYERTGSQGQPHDLAAIDNIGQLLERRNRIEEQRVSAIKNELKRAGRQLALTRYQLGKLAGLRAQSGDFRSLPLRWASVIPYYPWRDLCNQQTCVDVFRRRQFAHKPQQVPGGVFDTQPSILGGGRIIGCCSLSTKGHFFASECALEVLEYAQAEKERMNGAEPTSHWTEYLTCKAFIERTATFARNFYKDSRVEKPGYVQLSIGMTDVYGVQMGDPRFDRPFVPSPFIDEHFEAETTAELNLLIQNPTEATKPLFRQLACGFDLELADPHL